MSGAVLYTSIKVSVSIDGLGYRTRVLSILYGYVALLYGYSLSKDFQLCPSNLSVTPRYCV